MMRLILGHPDGRKSQNLEVLGAHCAPKISLSR